MTQPDKPRCETCRYWQSSINMGPWPDHKPARDCKRFPPTGLWGAIDSAKEYGIGKSLMTFHDDWCGEWQPLPSPPTDKEPVG